MAASCTDSGPALLHSDGAVPTMVRPPAHGQGWMDGWMDDVLLFFDDLDVRRKVSQLLYSALVEPGSAMRLH